MPWGFQSDDLGYDSLSSGTAVADQAPPAPTRPEVERYRPLVEDSFAPEDQDAALAWLDQTYGGVIPDPQDAITKASSAVMKQKLNPQQPPAPVASVGSTLGTAVGTLAAAPYGLREDGTPKGNGYFGAMKRSDGDVSTELSLGVDIDGKETSVPALVPTLSNDEKQWLLTNDLSDPSTIPPEIIQKATDYAKGRIGAGQSPFATDSDPRTGPLIARLGRHPGGFRDTETQVDPNATSDDPFTLAARAYSAGNVNIPYVTPVLDTVQKALGQGFGKAFGAAASGLEPTELANLSPNSANSAGPSSFEQGATALGTTLGTSLVPTKALDVALAAAPLAGEATDALKGGAVAIRELATGADANVLRVAVKDGAVAPAGEEGLAAARGAVNVTDPAGVRILKPGEAPAAGETVMYHGTAGNPSGNLRAGSFLTPSEGDAGQYANVTSLISKAQSPAGRLQSLGDSMTQRLGAPEFGGVTTPGPGEPPLSDFEKQMQASLKGKTQALEPPKPPADMRQELEAAGVNTEGKTNAQVVSRYRDFKASGVGTTAENVNNAARTAYNAAVDAGGSPEDAIAAARKAAVQETGSNKRASTLSQAFDAIKNGERGAVTPEGASFGLSDRVPETPAAGATPPGESPVPPTAGGTPPEEPGNVPAQALPPEQHGLFGDSVQKSFAEAEPTGGPFASNAPTASERASYYAQHQLSKFKELPADVESPIHRAYREVRDLVTSPIQFATFGHAPVLRQGFGYALSHPSEAVGALRNLARVAANPDAAVAINEGLNAQPFVKAAMDAGWFHEGTSDLPDTVVRRVINRVPGMQNSQQSARIYLTTLRKAGFENAAQALHASGVTDPNEYKALWDVMSDVTGHGLRGSSLSVGGISPLFSPQAMLGRFRGLTDTIIPDFAHPLAGGLPNPLAPTARGIAVRNLLALGGFTAAIEGTAKASGLNLNWDLGRTPLGKVQLGESTLDPTAGYSGIARMGYKLYEAAADGDKKAGVDTVLSYLRGQLGPVNDTVVSYLTGQDWQGKKFDIVQQAENGKLIKDLYEPIAAGAIEDSVKANGPIGALYAAPSLGAMSVETNLVTAARDKAVAAMNTTDVKGNPITNYADAGPVARNKADNTPEVIAARGGPTNYQETKATDEAPALAERDRNEALWEQGQNSQPLSGVYHDLGTANRATSKALETQFAQQFKGFSKTQYDNAVEGYYQQQKTVPAGQPNAGGIDFDATAAARQDYLNKLPPDQQEWLKQSILVAEDKKTQTQKDYDSYIADKKTAGYFGLDPKAPDYSKKKTALDAANPLIDYETWKYNATAGTEGGVLNTPKAVDMALADPHSKNIPVKYAGLARPVNQSPQAEAAWKYSQAPLTNYLNAGGPKNQQSFTDYYLSGKQSTVTGKSYPPGVKYAQLDPKDQNSINDKVRADLLKDPKLEAWHLWWNGGKEPTDPDVQREFAAILKQYGSKPPK